MQGIQQLIAIGRQGAHGVSQLGAGLLQRALDRVYGPPQLARKMWTARRRWTGLGNSQPTPTEARVHPQPIAAAEPSTFPALPAVAAQPPLAVAERIRTARLVGPHNILYGLMWLYIYPDQGIARRLLKVTDKHLAKALGRQYFKFADVPFDPVAGCKPLFDAMHAECKKVLNGRGGAMRVKPIHTRSESHRPPTSDARLRKALAAEAPEDARAIAPPAAGAVDAASSMPPVQGEAYQGIVTSAGRTSRSGPDGASYNTFCLTLNDGVREIPLYGTELERLSREQRVGPGDRVRVVFMGKAMTQVPGKARPAYRNLYQLSRMEEPS